MALMPAKFPKICVIGAGPIGLYTALVLTRGGCDVTLIDDGKRGAGWASGGMLGAAYEVLGAQDVPDEFKTFAFSSQWLWSQFLKALPVPTVAGSVFCARTEAETSPLSRLAQALKDREPMMQPCAIPDGISAREAWYAPQDIAFNPRHMLTVLRKECLMAGVTMVAGTAQHVETGRVTLDDGQAIAADQIIVTTGMAGCALADYAPELAHLAPVKGQMLAAASDFALKSVVRAGRLYLIPRGDRIVIGATSQLDDSDETTLDKDAHLALYKEAIALCPALARGQVVESWAGLRPMTPDGLPLLGFGQREGVILATGTYRNGWLLAAGIANHVLRLVLDDRATAANLQCLSPLRFPIVRARANCPDK
jgi:glycine oxidase